MTRICYEKDGAASGGANQKLTLFGSERRITQSQLDALTGKCCAELKGIIRTLPPENRARVCALFRETVEGVCAAMGARADVKIVESYPGVYNWLEAADRAAGVARALLGPERVRIIDTPTTGTEDFGYFIRNIPGCFYWIGVANPEIGPSHPLHSARFNPDEAALEALIALHVGVAMDYLS